MHQDEYRKRIDHLEAENEQLRGDLLVLVAWMDAAGEPILCDDRRGIFLGPAEKGSEIDRIMAKYRG